MFTWFVICLNIFHLDQLFVCFQPSSSRCTQHLQPSASEAPHEWRRLRQYSSLRRRLPRWRMTRDVTKHLWVSRYANGGFIFFFQEDEDEDEENSDEDADDPDGAGKRRRFDEATIEKRIERRKWADNRWRCTSTYVYCAYIFSIFIMCIHDCTERRFYTNTKNSQDTALV